MSKGYKTSYLKSLLILLLLSFPINFFLVLRPVLSLVHQGLHIFQQLSRTPFRYGPRGSLIILNLFQPTHFLLNTFQFRQILMHHIENVLHVPHQLIDRKINESQVP